MPIVTIISDFGTRDHYLGIIKGDLLKVDPSINFVDITHEVETYDIVRAAFILKNTYSHFPEGTIHIVSVRNLYQTEPKFLALAKNGHIFIGPDNGIFTLVFEQLESEVYEIAFTKSKEFPSFQVYKNVLSHLQQGLPFHEIGFPAQQLDRKMTLQAVVNENEIRATVIHVDRYENVIINVDKSLFESRQEGRSFEIQFKRHEPITTIRGNYFDVPIGEIVCFFNSSGYLEISINMGKAASLLGLKIDDAVIIEFSKIEADVN